MPAHNDDSQPHHTHDEDGSLSLSRIPASASNHEHSHDTHEHIRDRHEDTQDSQSESRHYEAHANKASGQNVEQQEPANQTTSHSHDPRNEHSHDEHVHPHHDKHEHSSSHSHDEHDHAHGHNHDGHEHPHGHSHDEHDHAHGRFGWLIEAIPFLHGHSHGEAAVDKALESSQRGIWALKISLVILGATALFQLIIALLSASVGLLADTIHNFSDAFTAIPLWIAFALARRAANRRYTYGYGRAEDVAGVIIVLIIFLSSLLAAYESYQKFFHPQPLQYAWWVIAAALVGFLGNEGVAIFRIRVGREIGSAALVADGQHARVDGLTSLAVIFGAAGSLLGFPLADPIIGVLITVAILFIVKDTAVVMWRRLMDAVDPGMVDSLERTATTIPGVEDVHEIRIRWIGHRLHAELHITVDEELSTYASHEIAEHVRHALFEQQPQLTTITVHVDPCGHSGQDPHALTAHHQPLRAS